MAAGLLELPPAPGLLAVASSAGLDLAAAMGGDDEALRPTEVAQPALLLVEVTLAAALGTAGLEIVGAAGHSVGEYAALVAAGALAPAAAMSLVVARGRAMAAMREGTMAALLGADEELAEAVCAEASAAGLGPVVVANLNAPGQVVLSGTMAAVEEASRLARERGAKRAVPLRVSGAFHSPLMAEAAAAFGAELDRAPLSSTDIPVVCNVDGAALQDAEGLRSRLERQLVSPVRWTDCVATLIGLGAEALVEVGPGGVLTGLARRIAPQATALSVSGLDEARAVTDRLGAAVGG